MIEILIFVLIDFIGLFVVFGLHDRVRLVCDWAGLGGRGGDDVHDSKRRAGTKINGSTLT